MKPRARQLLPQISSPLARRVVLYLFNHRWTYLSDDDSWPADIAEDPKSREYMERISGHLKASSLSKQLPGGMDFLPDYYAALPEPLGAWQRIIKPRSYPQLLEHLVGHLDWYVNPREKLSFQEGIKPFTAGIWIVSLIVSLLVVYLATSTFDYFRFVLFLFVVPMLVSKAKFNFSRDPESVIARKGSPLDARRSINATLLYRYLRDAYSDDSGGVRLPEASPASAVQRIPAMTGYPSNRKSPRC